jgi:hypothetical protein
MTNEQFEQTVSEWIAQARDRKFNHPTLSSSINQWSNCWRIPGPRFMLLVHHTDAEREYAYDRKSSVGKLDKALDEANAKGWTVVSMKDDWKQIFAFEH